MLLGASIPARAVEPTLLQPPGPPLAGTAPLTLAGDLASNLVAGADRFLDRQLGESPAARSRLRPADPAGDLATNRTRFARLLGVVETRPSRPTLELVGSLSQPCLVSNT